MQFPSPLHFSVFTFLVYFASANKPFSGFRVWRRDGPPGKSLHDSTNTFFFSQGPDGVKQFQHLDPTKSVHLARTKNTGNRRVFNPTNPGVFVRFSLPSRRRKTSTKTSERSRPVNLEPPVKPSPLDLGGFEEPPFGRLGSSRDTPAQVEPAPISAPISAPEIPSTNEFPIQPPSEPLQLPVQDAPATPAPDLARIELMNQLKRKLPEVGLDITSPISEIEPATLGELLNMINRIQNGELPSEISGMSETLNLVSSNQPEPVAEVGIPELEPNAGPVSQSPAQASPSAQNRPFQPFQQQPPRFRPGPETFTKKPIKPVPLPSQDTRRNPATLGELQSFLAGLTLNSDADLRIVKSVLQKLLRQRTAPILPPLPPVSSTTTTTTTTPAPPPPPPPPTTTPFPFSVEDLRVIAKTLGHDPLSVDSLSESQLLLLINRDITAAEALFAAPPRSELNSRGFDLSQGGQGNLNLPPTGPEGIPDLLTAASAQFPGAPF